MRTRQQEAQRVAGMVKTSPFSYITEESDRMLCCKVTWMLKSNGLVQCAKLLLRSLTDSMESLKGELLSQRLSVTYGQRH